MVSSATEGSAGLALVTGASGGPFAENDLADDLRDTGVSVTALMPGKDQK
ncbi:MAG TPA: hypothetical protein VFR99_03700 [Marmoricola sp.]|nr:hypothetical protein [Marmoricola sp.]